MPLKASGTTIIVVTRKFTCPVADLVLLSFGMPGMSGFNGRLCLGDFLRSNVTP
jgi:hypothetical protein